MGLSGAVMGLLGKEFVTGEGRLFAGDTARLRKGLLEDRPGEICLPESGVEVGMLADSRRVGWTGHRFRRGIACLFFGRHETGLLTF